MATRLTPEPEDKKIERVLRVGFATEAQRNAIQAVLLKNCHHSWKHGGLFIDIRQINEDGIASAVAKIIGAQISWSIKGPECVNPACMRTPMSLYNSPRRNGTYAEWWCKSCKVTSGPIADNVFFVCVDEFDKMRAPKFLEPPKENEDGPVSKIRMSFAHDPGYVTTKAWLYANFLSSSIKEYSNKLFQLEVLVFPDTREKLLRFVSNTPYITLVGPQCSGEGNHETTCKLSSGDGMKWRCPTCGHSVPMIGSGIETRMYLAIGERSAHGVNSMPGKISSDVANAASLHAVQEIEKHKKLADGMYEFLCGLNLQDHPIAEQKKLLELIRLYNKTYPSRTKGDLGRVHDHIQNYKQREQILSGG